MSRTTRPAVPFLALVWALSAWFCIAPGGADDQPAAADPEPAAARPGRVAIEIHGLESISKERLLERLGDRLIYARRAPATIARASDAAFFIERYLLNQGLDSVTVSGEPSADGRSLIIQVNEGPSRVLGEVTFEGADNVDHDTLRQLLNNTMLPHERRLVARTVPYVADRVQAGIDNINDYYKAAGYWRAVAVLGGESISNDAVDIVISVDEGPLHPLRSVHFDPLPQPLQSTLEELVTGEVGQPATAERIDTIRAQIAAVLGDLGYQRYSLSMRQEFGDDDMTLAITVDPGEILQFGNFSIKGLQRTRESVVASRFAPLEGQTYSSELLEREVNSLLASGAFNSVLVDDTIDPETNTIDFTITADEGDRRRLGFYGGFGSFEGPILGSTYEHLNLFGTLRQFNSRLELTGIGGLGEVRVVDQRFLGSHWEFSPRLFSLLRSYDGYTVSRTGLSLDWDRSYGDHYSVELQAGIEYDALGSIDIDRDLIGPTNYTAANLTLSQSLDFRDSITLPRDGWIMSLETSLVTDPFSNDFTFFRGRFDTTWYQPIGSRTVLSLGARAGIIEPLQGASVPIDQRFFLGGSTSVRGFAERRLGPGDDNNRPTGGEAYHVFNAELARDIAGPVALAGFADFGNLFPSAGDLRFDDWRATAGVGLRINLPIGPIRADYGWNLDQREGESSGAFHFSIGVSF